MTHSSASIRKVRQRVSVRSAGCAALTHLLFTAVSLGQTQTQVQPPSEAGVSAGLALIAQLKGAPEADAALFQQTGADRVIAELMAVVKRGEAPTATAADWTQMHRAFAALIELFTWQGQLLKASLFAKF